eukprot:1158364-Pelagomonas_calceolata.AAC.3
MATAMAVITQAWLVVMKTAVTMLKATTKMEGHTAFATQQDAEAEVMQVLELYRYGRMEVVMVVVILELCSDMHVEVMAYMMAMMMVERWRCYRSLSNAGTDKWIDDADGDEEAMQILEQYRCTHVAAC